MDKNFYNLLQNDEYGLLNDTQKNTPVTENDRVIDSFLEIVNFYEENKRLPNLDEVHERKLAVRLKTFIENIDQYNFILEYDKFNLLKESFKNTRVEKDRAIYGGVLNSSEGDRQRKWGQQEGYNQALSDKHNKEKTFLGE